MDDLDRRMANLDEIRTRDVWDQVERRSGEPDPDSSPTRSRRLLVAAGAFALFLGTAGVLALSVRHVPSPSPPRETVQGTLPPQEHSELPGILAMDFADATHGFVVRCAPQDLDRCRETELLATTDGGGSWEVLSEDGPRAVSFVTPIDGFGLRGRCATACHLTVVATHDGGATWMDVGTVSRRADDISGLNGSHESIDFTDTRTGWVNTGGTVHATLDGGSTWRDLSDPCPRFFELGGASPVDATTGFVVCESEPATDMAAKEVLRTGDGGSSWQIVSGVTPFHGGGPGENLGTLPIIGYGSHLRFVSDQIGFLLTDRGGVDMTTDGGVTFSRIIDTDDLTSPIDVAWFGSGGALAALWSGQVIRTTDGGNTWSQTFPEPTAFVTDVFSFADDEHGIAVGSGALTIKDGEIRSSVGLFMTDDGGQNWGALPSTDGPSNPGELDMPSPKIAYALDLRTRDRFFGSDDGGRTWTALSIPGDAQPTWMSWADDATGFLLAEHELYRTSDGGSSWERTGDRTSLVEIDAASATVLWGLFLDDEGFSGMVARSDDAGATWSDVAPVPGFRAAYVDALDPEHIWLEGAVCTTPTSPELASLKPGWCDRAQSMIVRTDDGGASWQIVNLRHGIGSIDFVSPTTGFAFSSQLLVTHDAGTTWDRV